MPGSRRTNSGVDHQPLQKLDFSKDCFGFISPPEKKVMVHITMSSPMAKLHERSYAI